ncbi:MAG TPA: hypothetical protein VIM33_10950, partial [Gaiellaceae bacterium]
RGHHEKVLQCYLVVLRKSRRPTASTPAMGHPPSKESVLLLLTSIHMLANIQFRGDRPQTKERWE